MRVLLTGGAGFIGSATAKALMARGDEVILIDNFNDTVYESSLKRDRIGTFLKEYAGKFTVCEGDIRDKDFLETVFARESIDRVVHLAALAGVRDSLKNPGLYVDVNVNGTVAMLDMAVRYKIKNFVYASSSSVYGNNMKMPYVETDSVDMPISPYAASKKADELFAHVYSYVHGLPTTGLRFFTVYGPWGRPDMAAFFFVKKVLEEREIEVFNFGELRRNFTYIDDIVSGIVTVLDKDMPYEVVNIGGDRDERVLDYIAAIERHTDKRANIKLAPLPPTDPASTVADISKLRSWDWEPTTRIDDGVKKLVEWYRGYYQI